MKTHLGKLLREKRLGLSITQKQISDSFKFTTSQFISNVELGKSPLPPELVRPLAKMLKTPAKHLVDAAVKDYRAQYIRGAK